MEKIRIGLLHFSAPPVLGGVEVIMGEMANLFVNNGYPTSLIVARGDDEYDSDLLQFKRIEELDSKYPENQDIHEKVMQGKDVQQQFDAYKELILHKLDKALEDVDVCLIHNALVKDLNLPLVAAIRELAEKYSDSKTFVNWIHDASYMGYKKPEWAGKKDEFPWKLITEYDPNIVNVAISSERRRQTAELYSIPDDQIEVIGNGIDIPKFLEVDPEIAKLWERFNLYDRDFVLFLPARIVHRKNVELGIRLTEEINNFGYTCSFIVTGKPSLHLGRRESYYKRMRELIEQRDLDDYIIFLYEKFTDSDGNRLEVTDKRIRDLYRMADALLYPSYEEGFGLPVLEASLYRIPAICSKIRPLLDFENFDMLYIKPQGDPEAEAHEVMEFINCCQGFEFRKRVFTEYRWIKVFERDIEPFIQKVYKGE